jgi:hypothetical protein
MTPEALRRRRAAAQLLAGARKSPHHAVSALLAVQAQDPRAAKLALRARGAAASAAEVDAALAREGSLVVTWLMRGTLHLVARDDLGWLHALTGRQGAATTRRRLAELGVPPADAERAPDAIEGALEAEGMLTRAQLAERMLAAGIPAEGQAVPHLLGLAAGRGTIVSTGEAFVLARDWLGAHERAEPDRDAALAELARRYLRGHGPATAADLAAWSGLGLRAARAGLAAIAPALEQAGNLVDLAARPVPPHALPARLLPAFDPYLLGWKDRSFAVDPAHARRVHPGGGMLRATAIADGRAVATWTAPGGVVALDPFAPLAPDVEAELRGEADRVARF